MHIFLIVQQFLTRNSNAARELGRNSEIYNVKQQSTGIAFTSFPHFHQNYLEIIYSLVVRRTLLTYTSEFNYSPIHAKILHLAIYSMFCQCSRGCCFSDSEKDDID